MDVHGFDGEDEESDYEPGIDNEHGGVHVTIHPVYGSEAADYLDHLFSGRCPPEVPPQ
jgi:hypothetical protein